MVPVSLACKLTVHFVPAVLAAGAPEQTAFMSDEAMESIPGLKPIQYTAKHYKLYLNRMTERTKALNKGEVIKQKQLTIVTCSKLLKVPCFWKVQSRFVFPVVLSGSTAGLDAPQTGAVFVGSDSGDTAAAPASGGRRYEEQRCVWCVLRPWRWPQTNKETQNCIKLKTSYMKAA